MINSLLFSPLQQKKIPQIHKERDFLNELINLPLEVNSKEETIPKNMEKITQEMQIIWKDIENSGKNFKNQSNSNYSFVSIFQKKIIIIV